MLPDDQRRAGGAHGERRGAGAEDQRRGPAQGARRAGQAVSRQAGRDGEVEGMSLAPWPWLERALPAKRAVLGGG